MQDYGSLAWVSDVDDYTIGGALTRLRGHVEDEDTNPKELRCNRGGVRLGNT